MERLIETLPEWAQTLFGNWLHTEMSNEATVPNGATLTDTYKIADMVLRAYIQGYKDRTKQLRPVPTAWINNLKNPPFNKSR